MHCSAWGMLGYSRKKYPSKHSLLLSGKMRWVGCWSYNFQSCRRALSGKTTWVTVKLSWFRAAEVQTGQWAHQEIPDVPANAHSSVSSVFSMPGLWDFIKPLLRSRGYFDGANLSSSDFVFCLNGQVIKKPLLCVHTKNTALKSLWSRRASGSCLMGAAVADSWPAEERHCWLFCSAVNF